MDGWVFEVGKLLRMYVGDCIFAVFGIPNFVREETSLDACKAAISMRYALQKFKELPRVSGEWVLEGGAAKPKWKNKDEI